MTGFCGACEGIENEVFRLHILANSDSDEDQSLKLKVRDGIIAYTGSLLEGCTGKEEAMCCAEQHIEDIRQCAQQIVYDCGYEYDVNVYSTEMYFNTRKYDEITLPAGKYDALRIVIGSGEGHNWWCMIYPSLCLPSAGGEKLDEVLNAGEYDVVKDSSKYEVRFFVVELIEGFASLFS